MISNLALEEQKEEESGLYSPHDPVKKGMMAEAEIVPFKPAVQVQPEGTSTPTEFTGQGTD